jgi:hypothetical protein
MLPMYQFHFRGSLLKLVKERIDHEQTRFFTLVGIGWIVGGNAIV